MTSALLLGLALLVPASPGDPVVLDDVQYGAKQVGDPDYEETITDIIFPSGSGPVSSGYAADPKPLAVIVRGGNANKPIGAPASLDSDLVQAFLARDFIVAFPNYGILELGVDDYTNVGPDVARVVQFLRTDAAALNIDPQRVALIGRSGGAFLTYLIGLREDHQDLASPDVVMHASSRPQAIMCWLGISDLDCFHPLYPELQWFFAGVPLETITPQQKQEASPNWWLANPHLYDRAFTPYVGLANDMSIVGPCHWLTNVHDGLFALIMQDALQAYDASVGPESDLFEQSILIDTEIEPTAVATAEMAAWVADLPCMQETGSWVDLGHALAGVHGPPVLSGSGTLQPGSSFGITLTGAAESALAYLVVGYSAIDAPFRGGVFVPNPLPPGFILPVVTDDTGTIAITGVWPTGLPGGVGAAYAQYWIVDPVGPLGVAASNGLEVVGA